MIIAPDWIWLHFPKCAGTSTEKTLGAIYKNDKAIHFDALDHNNVIWHHTLQKRKEYDPDFTVGDRRIICNIRRLPHWILSRVHYEVQRSGRAAEIKRRQLVEGRFPQRHPHGRPTIHPADSVAARFSEGVTHWVRVENLAEDLSNALNLKEEQVSTAIVHENTGKLSYIRNLAFWFTQKEIDRMYAANPVWAELEQRLYGDTLHL